MISTFKRKPGRQKHLAFPFTSLIIKPVESAHSSVTTWSTALLLLNQPRLFKWCVSIFTLKAQLLEAIQASLRAQTLGSCVLGWRMKIDLIAHFIFNLSILGVNMISLYQDLALNYMINSYTLYRDSFSLNMPPSQIQKKMHLPPIYRGVVLRGVQRIGLLGFPCKNKSNFCSNKHYRM